MPQTTPTQLPDDGFVPLNSPSDGANVGDRPDDGFVPLNASSTPKPKPKPTPKPQSTDLPDDGFVPVYQSQGPTLRQLQPANPTYGPTRAQLGAPPEPSIPRADRPNPSDPYNEADYANLTDEDRKQAAEATLRAAVAPIPKEIFGAPSATELYDRSVQAVKNRWNDTVGHIPLKTPGLRGTEAMGRVASGAAAFGRVVPEAIDFMTSPLGVASGVALGPVAGLESRAARGVVGTGLAATMAPQAYESTKEFVAEPSWERAGTAAKDIALAASPLGLAVRRGPMAVKPVESIPEPQKPSLLPEQVGRYTEGPTPAPTPDIPQPSGVTAATRVESTLGAGSAALPERLTGITPYQKQLRRNLGTYADLLPSRITEPEVPIPPSQLQRLASTAPVEPTGPPPIQQGEWWNHPERGSMPVTRNRSGSRGSKDQIPKRERRPIAQVTFSSPQADDLSKDVSLFYNVDKLDPEKITPEGKQALMSAVEGLKNEIYAKVGDRMTFDEIQSMAAQHPDLLPSGARSSEATLAESVRRLNARVSVAQALERVQSTGTFTAEDLNSIVQAKSLAADAGRLLRSYGVKIRPTDPKAAEFYQIIQDVLKHEKNLDTVLAEAKNYDLNDPEQATKFYRAFVKPKLGDWANALRYSSMLSSPNTHWTNLFSNLFQSAPVTAVTKAIEGGMDAALTGVSRLAGVERPRTRYAGESVEYLKGYYGSRRLATENLVRSLRGETPIGNPDFKRQMPMTTKDQTILHPIENTLTAPQKALEAADQFFITLTTEGEKRALRYRESKGVSVPNMEQLAQEKAKYTMFRAKLGEAQHGGSQGGLLDLMDEIPQRIMQMRNSPKPAVKFVANIVQPFVTTPANIFKQGVEYSPMGWATMIGHEDKIAQAAKAAVGTAVATTFAMLASSDSLTWGEPVDPKSRAEFRKAGRIPYAFRVGNRWIQYSKLPPAIAFPAAMIANYKQLYDSGKMSDDEVVSGMQMLARHFRFMADQSYMKSLGDFIGAASGEEGALARYLSNPVSQFMPYRGFVSWIERLTDPVQRRADPSGTIIEQQWQQLKAQIPGLAQTVPPRTDRQGEPVENQDRVLNSLMPTRVTTVNPEKETEFKESQQLSAMQSRQSKAAGKERSQAEKEWQTIRTIKDPHDQATKLVEVLDKMTPKGQDSNAPDYQMTAGQKHLVQLYNERAMTALELDLKGKSTEVRAQHIYKKWQKMPESDRTDYLERLREQKILTKAVDARLTQLSQPSAMSK